MGETRGLTHRLEWARRALAALLTAGGLCLSGPACQAAPSDAPFSTADFQADRRADLAPVAAFMPGPAARPARLPVSGRLSLTPRASPDGFHVLVDRIHPTNDQRRAWPSLSIDLVSDGGRLIPRQGGPFPTANPEWEWRVEPGRVWSEPGDGAAVRILLPVALEERNANCVHNGRLLALVGPSGVVGQAIAQFDADTCLYYQFDAWSQVAAAFTPGPVADAGAVISRDRDERARRLKTRGLGDLVRAYPGLDLAALRRAAGPRAVWGLAIGDTHYAAPCPTRAGDDPLCAERDLPSYSTAKTLVAAQALMRLEALRPGAQDETVAAHVPACAQAGGWSDVRLIDLLDMASGHFISRQPEGDEDAPATQAFFDAETADQKLAFACGAPRKAAPGGVFTYHTADTFLLGAAMTDLMRRQGLGSDLYADLIQPIWRAIGQSAALDTTRRTYDAAALPFSGWGLVYHRDDVIRAARFLDQGGQISGRPYLDRRRLAEGLQKVEPGGGLTAILPEMRYRHGIWARNVAPLIGCGHPVWTPFMSGYGGISVVLFPNAVQFYAFNGDNHFDWTGAVREVDKIASLCR